MSSSKTPYDAFLERLNQINATYSKPDPLDVIHLLKLACNDLGNGELIHGEDFDLSATMSVVKGVIIPFQKLYETSHFLFRTTTVMELDQKLYPDFVYMNYNDDEAIINDDAPVPLSSDRTIDTQRLIDVMDHLLTCEATWHEGASLHKTIYSCIYLRKLDRLSSHALLHSLCRSVAVTCNSIFLAISSAQTENEVIRNSNFGLSKGDGDDKCLSALQSVEETIIRKLKACTASLSKKKDFKDVEPLQTNPNLEEDFCKAVLCRLRFRKHFYRVLTSARRTGGKGLEMAKKHIDFCLVELDSMLKSEIFLKSLCRVLEDSLSENKTTASGCQPVGFDSPINTTLVTPTAINRAYATLTRPRAVQLLSWKKAVSYFQKLLNDLSIIYSSSPHPVLEDAVHFVVDFHKFQPGSIARAHIQLLLFQDGKFYGREPIFATICKAALLPKSANTHYIQNHETVAKLGKLLTHLLKIICKSIEVQRRSLARTLVVWEHIFIQLKSVFKAEFGDPTKPPNYKNMSDKKICRNIHQWVDVQKDWIALRFVLLGFDLELYTPSEYCMVYCNIWMLLMALSRKRTKMFWENIEAVAHSSDSAASSSYDADSSSATRKVKKRRDLREKIDLPDEVKLLICYTDLVQGLITVLGILKNDYNAFQCVGPFNSEEERFIQHFKPLQEAGYSIVTYIDYKKTIDKVLLSNLHTKNLQTHDSFKYALKMVRKLEFSFAKDPNRLAEVDQIKQVAERNELVLNQIRRTPDPPLKVSFGFVHHPHFVVASLEESS